MKKFDFEQDETQLFPSRASPLSQLRQPIELAFRQDEHPVEQTFVFVLFCILFWIFQIGIGIEIEIGKEYLQEQNPLLLKVFGVVQLFWQDPKSRTSVELQEVQLEELPPEQLWQLLSHSIPFLFG